MRRGDSRAPSWKRAQHVCHTAKPLKLGLRARGGVAFPAGGGKGSGLYPKNKGGTLRPDHICFRIDNRPEVTS